MATPSAPVPDRQNAYYASTPAALREAAAALAEAGAALDAAARALRRMVSIEEAAEPSPDSAPLLRGEDLRRVVVQVASGIAVDGRPFYYRDLFALVERAGYRVGGRDPLATFLTTLSRTPEFEAQGGRSGMYLLTNAGSG